MAASTTSSPHSAGFGVAHHSQRGDPCPQSMRIRRMSVRIGEIAMQLNRDDLLRAYRSMATIRRFEERVQEEFSKGGIPGFVHLYAGEEASAVGMCMHLSPND